MNIYCIMFIIIFLKPSPNVPKSPSWVHFLYLINHPPNFFRLNVSNSNFLKSINKSLRFS